VSCLYLNVLTTVYARDSLLLALWTSLQGPIS